MTVGLTNTPVLALIYVSLTHPTQWFSAASDITPFPSLLNCKNCALRGTSFAAPRPIRIPAAVPEVGHVGQCFRC